MKKVKITLLFNLIVCLLVAQKGKDGPKITVFKNDIVNEYAPLVTDAQAGNSTVTVNNATLNTSNRFANPLSAGDLIMIIQMQGATIIGTNDSTWGTVSNYNNCGLNEFAEVAGVTSTTISVKCPLKNTYTALGKAQVVRVPRYSSLTVTSGDTITCAAWSGTTGGILTIEVNDSIIVNPGGCISAIAKGFRGGALINANGDLLYIIKSYRATLVDSGAVKGEGIAGYMSDYNTYGGMYCRGAAANGGGGGNDHNAGGGGGSNAGNLNTWTGNGIPDISNNSWAQAWNLEYAGFANSITSGGGRGGYTNSASSTANPLTTPPGSTLWGYDNRQNVGGKGGRPLDYSTGRLFLGGGGGAGHENNDAGGGGGIGGGLIYLLGYNTLSGAGTIIANGGNGLNTDVTYGRDGSGGGGGGGAVILNCINAITDVSVYANGGNGGNQIITTNEAEGTGGGGGGGYIAISNGNVTRHATGGANGTTSCPSFALFPPNGATKGGDGLTNGTVPPTTVSASVSSDISFCLGVTYTLHAYGGTSYTWSPSTGLDCDTCANPTVTPTANITYMVTIVGGGGACSSSTDSITTDSIKLTVFSIPKPTISTSDSIFCSNDSTRINALGTYSTYLWNNGDNHSYTYATYAGGYWVTVTDVNGCSAVSPHKNISVYPVSSVTIVEMDDSLYSFDAVSYQWIYDNNIISGATSPIYIAPKTGYYALQITDTFGCNETSNNLYVVVTGIGSLSSDKNMVEVYPNPFSSTIYIQYSDVSDHLNKIEIADMNGRRVWYRNFTNTPYMKYDCIDVSFLPKGTYILYTSFDKETNTQFITRQ